MAAEDRAHHPTTIARRSRRAVGESRTLAATHAATDAGSAPRRRQRDPRPAWPAPRRTPARISGNTAASFPASRRSASTGGARRATIIFMCASRNGKPRTPSGSGPDRSPSMAFASPLVRDSKLYRALVVAFALAEVLVEGGERVGIPGLMRPTGSRNIIDRMAQAIVHDRSERAAACRRISSPSPLAEIVLLSDLWSDIADVRRTHRTAFRQRRARPRRADRRSGRRDLSLLGPRRIRRAGRRRPHHRRPRRDLARRLCRARARATAPKSAPRPTGSAGASPSTAPTGRRANCCSPCIAASAA